MDGARKEPEALPDQEQFSHAADGQETIAEAGTSVHEISWLCTPSVPVQKTGGFIERYLGLYVAVLDVTVLVVDSLVGFGLANSYVKYPRNP